MITMRTPGLDPELAIGHLLSEGILSRELKELVDFFPLNHAVSSVPENPAQNGNNVFITLTPAAYQRAMAAKKRGPAHASCGVCSKTSSEQIRGMLKAVKPFSKNDLQVGSISPQTILRAPEILRSVQPTFALTGGTHGCALLKADGIVLAQAEDIGRHNAVDKLMGKVALNKDLKNLLEHKTTFLVLSGRVSFELIQKSIMSGIKTIVAVGAPSSYAIDLAKEFQMTLIGFVRDNRFNIYAGAERIYDNEKK
jgi:FdhD protein